MSGIANKLFSGSQTNLTGSNMWGKLIAINSDVHPNVSLSKSDIWFGRDASLCDVVFNDGTVSKQHFRMYCERGAEGKEIALLQDTSSNGTYVDGVLVGKGNTFAVRDGCIITLNVTSIDDKKFHKQSVAYLYLSRAGLENGFPNSISDEEMERIKKRVFEFQQAFNAVLALFKDFQEACEVANSKSNQWLYKTNVYLAGGDASNIMQILYKIQALKEEFTKSTNETQKKMSEFSEYEIDKPLKAFEEAKNANKELLNMGVAEKRKEKKASSTDLVKDKQKMEDRLGDAEKKNKLNIMATLLRLKEADAKKNDCFNDMLIEYIVKYSDFFKKAHVYLQSVEEELNSLKFKINKNLRAEEEKNKQQIKHIKIFTNANQREKQGYLLRKGKPIWFCVTDGSASYFKNWKSSLPIQTIDLTLCSVAIDSKKKFAFDIVTPIDRIALQANTKADFEDWLKVLKNSIAHQIQQHSKLQEQSGERYKTLTATLSFQSSTLPPLSQVQMQCEENMVCADCGSPDPDWASTNLGVLMCYDCSGVHRSLGTHITKIRSLTLDKWEPQLLQVLKCLGNKVGNSIYEADVPPKYRKPRKETPRPEREKYIIAKYRRKRFVKPRKSTEEDLSKHIYELVMNASTEDTSEASVPQIVALIAEGGNVNWSNRYQQGSTALHFAAASGNVLLSELLIQNDSNVSATDCRGWTPFFYAAQTDALGCARLLINRGARINVTDMTSETPLSIAKLHKSENVRMLIEGHGSAPSNETPRVDKTEQ
eukprot:TRINITY_DN1129_c0_g2_i1.p1 TRINITY_DN1129_c0_g2~~TRINITY_DN1129_c0_g2_i1.p1  ORF type:complete len:766 (-),score=225.90 TRINITY_DN1129_c0_g2_i1:128-2425(-)